MKKEEIYARQMQDLGIYDAAFEPAIHELCILERELSRARKAWSATVPKGRAPSLLDPHYAVICSLRRDVAQHREALGLTPKAYRRLRPEATGAADSEPAGSANRQLAGLLDRLKERTDGGA